MNGIKLADNNSDFWDGTLDAALNITENGTARIIPPGGTSLQISAWSGTFPSGIGIGLQELGSANISTHIGLYTVAGSWISSFNFARAGLNLPLYAISDELSVVPEPGALAIFALGVVGLSVVRRRAR